MTKYDSSQLRKVDTRPFSAAEDPLTHNHPLSKLSVGWHNGPNLSLGQDHTVLLIDIPNSEYLSKKVRNDGINLSAQKALNPLGK